MTLSDAARAVGGTLQGDDVCFDSVSTDSRVFAPGALFVALIGPAFDGHAYVEQALAQGAVAALVSHPVSCELPQIIVSDTRLALGRLASDWRHASPATVIGVTGSNGKTTVKEMLAAILGQMGPTLATQGNLNNDIGMPLTLLRLQPAHRFAVIEMGTNHPGEIEYLTRLASPDVALITNASSAHLAGLGDVAGVAREKGTIYAGLSEKGIAVVNRDDVYAGYWRELNAGRKVVGFGLTEQADVWAQWTAQTDGSELMLHAPQGDIQLHLPLLGQHNVANAMAASAAALAVGASLEDIKRGLEAMRPVKGRMQLCAGLHGARLINDTYNANPASLAAALSALENFSGRKFLVLGDMGELGEDAEAFHRQVGVDARARGVERLFATGPLSCQAVQAFGTQAQHFETQQQLIDAVRGQLSEQVTVLVKGSRSMRMEQVVEALSEKGA